MYTSTKLASGWPNTDLIIVALGVLRLELGSVEGPLYNKQKRVFSKFVKENATNNDTDSVREHEG